MSNVKFHHNSLNQFLFQTPDGITLNIPPGEEVVTTEEIARFILEQVKSGGGSYTATDELFIETMTVPDKPSIETWTVLDPDDFKQVVTPKETHTTL